MYTMVFSFVLCIAVLGFAEATTITAKQSPNERDSHASRDWNGLRVLHIGDSHLQNWGLKGTLRKKFKQAGAAYNVSAWKGSSARSWLRTGKLHRLLRTKNPDVVIVNLGTNICRAKHPRDYAKFIKRMVRKISPRQCYWVAPPPLIADTTAFYNMLEEASKPCIFLDSRKIEFDVPHKKVFHLSRNQSAVWAEQIWEWMNESSYSPEKSNGF